MNVAKCRDLAEVRQNIDRIDRMIVPLIAERTAFVEQAAGFKATKHDVVDNDRIEEIVLKVRHQAIEYGLDPDLAEKVWRALIDASIIHEAKKWTELHSQS